MKTIALLALLLITGCATVHGEHTWGYNVDSPPYPIAASKVTPKGIHYDPSGQAISGVLIDRLVDEVGECLGQSIDRSKFTVKIASDWTLTCDGSQQVLPATGAGDLGCDAKGLTREPGCPCSWRAYIQWPNVIVTTPSMYLLKDAVTRFETGSKNPWASPTLSKCATPSTLPLSDGSE